MGGIQRACLSAEIKASLVLELPSEDISNERIIVYDQDCFSHGQTVER